MPRSELHEPLGTIGAACVTNVFGSLTSNAPIRFDHVAGIVSVNTQARRLGCLTFLAGKVAKGRKIESLLLSMPAQEIAALNDNLRLNGHMSGQLTNKASSIEHYLDAAIQLHLLAKQGAIFALTNRGRFLTDVVLPNSVEPYPLPDAAKIYFLDSVLRADFFGIVALLGLLLRDVDSLSALQENYRDELLAVLDRIARSSLDSRLRRIAQDRAISIRNWRKPESYAEHLVPAQVNWLIDLDVIEPPTNQRYMISAPHRPWLEDAVKNVVPSEADLVSYVLSYARIISSNDAGSNADICAILDGAFNRIAPRGALVKVRCADLLLYLLCFHSRALLKYAMDGTKLFSESVVNCDGRSYRFTLASRSTQSFVVCTQKGKG
jgi:hypothetical protein